MSNPAAPRSRSRGRWLVVAALAAGAALLIAAIVDLATREGGEPRIELTGESDMQALFGGLPQAGDRLGESEAPVTIQIFNDITCDNCSDQFLDTVPGLVEQVVRDGEAKLIYRHYSFSIRPVQEGFIAAEAAAEQGYQWPFIYLFFANQDEAKRVGPQGFDEFIQAISGSIPELEPAEFDNDLADGGGADGEYTQRIEQQDEVARGLGLRAEPSAIVSGPEGTVVLQDSPSLDDILEAVEEVQ
jgi:protein-disulfide isomerase